MLVQGSELVAWILHGISRSCVLCRKTFTIVASKLISMNNFQLSLWSQQNSVNQIIHLFDDNVGTLPGELHYKQTFLAFL